MTKVQRLVAALKVVTTAAPTVLAGVVLAAPIVAEEAAKVLPAPWSDRVTAVCLTVAAAAGAAVAVIRRVTPVVKAQRGILPR